MQNFGPKMHFFWPKINFFRKWSKFLVTIMTGHPIGSIFVLTLLQGGPRAGCRGQFFARNSSFFNSTPMKPPFFFVNGPSVALSKTVDLTPSDQFVDFLFPSYIVKTEAHRQKCLPLTPLWGLRLPGEYQNCPP